MVVADVLKLIQDNEVKFVDLRFTDTNGKRTSCKPYLHILLMRTKFEDGHPF
jgi:glutamine synthetase